MSPLTCIFTCKYKHCQACETLVHSPPEENEDQPTTKGSSQLGFFFNMVQAQSHTNTHSRLLLESAVRTSNFGFFTQQKNIRVSLLMPHFSIIWVKEETVIKKNPKEVLSISLLKDNKHKWAINSGKDGGGREGEGRGDFNQPFHVLFILK